MANPVDLKQLIQLINDQKGLDTNLCLDSGCVIDAEDKNSLIKIINYFLNYLHQLSDKTMEISLDLMGSSILMVLMSFTDKDSLPEISPNLKGALDSFKAKYELVHKAGNYVQIKIEFAK
ncbi:MAG: hypothetical protein D8M58_18570 [Calditrichaeota bacterium]|nr:MAG: hypothetical protein DWQ03_11800 [Calditrichota bacterium]MBL1207414.1 hypothetical protein [Calditrichota bacterium]NOG47246.1 hypothetical protein [Calditrichota bacterium]